MNITRNSVPEKNSQGHLLLGAGLLFDHGPPLAPSYGLVQRSRAPKANRKRQFMSSSQGRIHQSRIDMTLASPEPNRPMECGSGRFPLLVSSNRKLRYHMDVSCHFPSQYCPCAFPTPARGHACLSKQSNAEQEMWFAKAMR